MQRHSILAAREAVGTTLRDGVPFATRCTTGYQGLSDVANTSALYRTFHVVATDASAVRLVFGNSYGPPASLPSSTSPSGAVAPNPDPITVRSGVEFRGSVAAVTFSGLRSVVIPPGGVVVSDPVSATFSRADRLWVRTRVESKPSTGGGDGRWPVGLMISKLNGTTTDVEGYVQPARLNIGSDVDATAGGPKPTPTQNARRVYSPMAIVGRVTSATYRSVLLVGDSIINGLGEDSVALGVGPLGNGPGSNTLSEQGFAVRAFDPAGVGYLKICQPGDRAQWFVASAQRDARMRLAQYCDNALCNYGRNDLVAGQTLAAVQADLLRVWTILQWSGLRVIQTTITPTTLPVIGTSREVAHSSDPARQSLNAWLRAGAPVAPGATVNTPCDPTQTFPPNAFRAGDPAHPLSGIADIAAALEAPGGLWATGPDGLPYANSEVSAASGAALRVHPNTQGHIAASRVLTAALPLFQ